MSRGRAGECGSDTEQTRFEYSPQVIAVVEPSGMHEAVHPVFSGVSSQKHPLLFEVQGGVEGGRGHWTVARAGRHHMQLPVLGAVLVLGRRDRRKGGA